MDEFDLFEDDPTPPLKTVLKNALCACGRFLLALITFKRVKVSKDVYDKRMDICRSCDFLLNGKRCSSCGCYVKPKCSLTTEKCPEGYW